MEKLGFNTYARNSEFVVIAMAKKSKVKMPSLKAPKVKMPSLTKAQNKRI